jgi:hypothetical protein
VLLVFIGVIVLLPFISFALGLIVAIIAVAGIGTAMVGGLLGGMQFFPEFASFVSTCQPMLLTALICGLIVVVLPIYGIIRLLRGGKKMRASVLTSLIVVWLLALGLGIASTIATCIKGDEWSDTERDQREYKQSLKELKAIGWELKETKNLDEDFTDNRTGFGGLPRYCICLDTDKYDEDTYTAVLEKEVELTEDGSYHFVSLTEGFDAGLTYTFKYKDGGKDKEAILRPSDGGTHLNKIDFNWDMVSDGLLFPNVIGETDESWRSFSRYGEDWVCHWVDLPHVDAGKYKITIKANECSERIKIREVKVVKKNKQQASPTGKPAAAEEKK